MNASYFVLPLNMDRVCRVCLSEGTNLSPIFCAAQDVDDFSGLSQKIQVCGSIDIHEQDGLPSLICDECTYKASVAHEFRQQCQHSDARLRLYYNKPARCNIVESSTQTDPQTRIVLTKKTTIPQSSYFVKQEMQANAQEYCASNEPFAQTQASMESSMDMHEEKLFVCSMGFEDPKSDEKETVVTEVNTLQTACPPQELMVVDQTITLPFKESEGQDEKMDESKNTEVVIDGTFLDEGILTETIEEEVKSPPKRTLRRKTKSLQSKGYSDDEVAADDYYDPNNDSEDSDELRFKCKYCSKSYSTQKGLKNHLIVHDKKYKCYVCMKSFYKLKNLEKHKTMHASKPHSCELCHACFSKSQSLVRHLKSHTEKVNNIIKQISTDVSKDEGEPKKELKSEEDTDDEMSSANEPDGFENAPELYKCDVCNQYCSSLKNLKRHALVHGDKKYSCTVCEKWFFRPDTLKKHAEKHGHGLLDNLVDDNKLFDSDDEPFVNSAGSAAPGNAAPVNNCARKEDSDDEGTGEYKCQHCDKVMGTKKGLRRHVSMHKPKAEPVTCEICKKVCASQARLVLHQKTHNKPKEKTAREYLCHICSKVYPSNSSLTYHMRTHTGVKPHVCKTCNSGFTTTTSLANHIRIHTGDKPFVCHVCSAAFAVSSAFRRHLTRHTGEANYLCKTCGKAFKRLSTLKEHTYTHSGEKPYVCKTCGAAYSHSGSLFAHQKRCRAQYGEIVVEDHHHAVPHHIHVNNVQTAVRSLAVIGQMF